MSAPLDTLFELVREECTPRSWSRGVELARTDAVIAEREGDGELDLRVATGAGLISPSVTLYLEHQDWECDCRSREDVCEHVAAAVIAARRAAKDGTALPAPGGEAAPGFVRYCFTRRENGLELHREIVSGERAEPLRSTLDAVASGRVEGPPFSASEADVEVERGLGSKRSGFMDRTAMRRIVGPLARCQHILLDGEPIQVWDEPLLPRVVVEDQDGGFRVSLQDDPNIRERYRNDAVLCAAGEDGRVRVLRMRGPSGLTGRELEDYGRGRFFPPDRVAELVTEVLPSLEERLPLVVESRRLPTTSRDKPRIALAVERRESRLSVLATLVYGDPARARVDGGRLVHIDGPVPVRDELGESLRIRHLRDTLGLTPGRRIELSGADALAFARRLEAWTGELAGDAHQDFHEAPAIAPRIELEGGRFELFFETEDDDGDGAPRRADPDAVLRAWREGDSLVPLAAGGLSPLPADFLARHGERLADLLAARDEAGAVPTCALPDLGRLCEDLEHPAPPGLDALEPLLHDFEGIPKAALPDDLRADLRGYQREGIDWLGFLQQAGLGALLADDMGLGKTLQALCALEGRALVVAPTSVLHSWEAEAERFRPGLRVCLYHGPGRALDPEADLTLTSYALLRLEAERIAAEEWDCVVLDEAQNVKNPDSQVAQAAYRLKAGFRMALTGTPVENRLDELWSQLHFLNRGLLGGRSDFRERYARPIAEGDELAAERLRERIRPFVLRRLKRDVAAELPPRTDVVLHLDLSQEERGVYDAVRAATVEPVVARLRAGGNVMAALEALLRLRQAACHPGLVPGQEGVAIEAAGGSSKLALLQDRIEQAVEDGHKALVFSQWTALLDRVEPVLEEIDVPYERLDGSTRDRGGVVGRFQGDSGAPVMLVSLKAGGTGLNLTAADHVFLLDPWWNPAVEDQAADRAHRIGQTRPVVVHRLVARDTVEERILELHARKRALADAALAGGIGQDGDGLTRDDLLALLD